MVIANFIIAGVPKAGTSSLHAWLAAHPDAAASREKETGFFVDPGSHLFGRRGGAPYDLERYGRHFPVAPGREPRLVLESTPSYLYAREALRRIPDLPTRPRCVFVVREPSSQIFSLYRYFRENWSWIPAGMSFREFVSAARRGEHGFGGNELARDALRNAAYVDFLEPWRDRLGPDRMRVHSFDALRADPRGLVAELARWAGLDPRFYDARELPRENEGYAVRWRPLQELNVALRGRLPKGRLYRAARDAYRSLNTRAAPGPSDEDRVVLDELRSEYRAPNERLARSFALALPGW